MQNIDPLVFDLVEWVAKEPRRYAEVMEAWRTSCPRLTVWEDAIERGLIRRETLEGQGACVVITAAGQQFLRESGRHITTQDGRSDRTAIAAIPRH